MNTLFLEYRDPLFSIIIFFVLIFIVTFFSYWWGRYKQKEDTKHLNKFIKQFHTLPTEDEIKVLVANGGLSDKLWLLLAKSYYKNGDYEKSIEIYNEMLHNVDKKRLKEVMFLLGKTYFKAGFLERSKKIFLEILKTAPRTPEVLHYLLLVYEYTREYKAALGVLEPLDALDEDIVLDKDYLVLLSTLQNPAIDDNQKTAIALEIYQKNNHLGRMIFEFLFQKDPVLAWNYFDSAIEEQLVDILWNLERNDVNFDIISGNSFLQALYSAKGYGDFIDKSDIFEFDILIALPKRVNATLNFEYVCRKCKGNYPFSFHRCSHCHAIDTMEVEWSLSKDYFKDYSEENNSFQ